MSPRLEPTTPEAELPCGCPSSMPSWSPRRLVACGDIKGRSKSNRSKLITMELGAKEGQNECLCGDRVSGLTHGRRRLIERESLNRISVDLQKGSPTKCPVRR